MVNKGTIVTAVHCTTAQFVTLLSRHAAIQRQFFHAPSVGCPLKGLLHVTAV